MATMVQAVRLALHYGETHLGVTDVFGEDVGPPLGGVFTATQGLKTAWNSPLDERGIIGTAMGIAYAGGRPVAEIQFCDYGFNTIDLLKVAGNQRWAGAGNYDLPMVLMTPSGSGIRGSLYHSHSFESWASRLAGWKIVMPSNALDAYGLMLSAIVDPNPVLVLLPKAELPEQIAETDRMIGELKGRYGITRPIWLMPILESALGIENVSAIAQASKNVVALSIGLEDYTADLGVAKTTEGRESLYARSRLVNAAKALGVQAIDSAFGDVGDMDGLRRWAESSRALGFEGMGCIHPGQIPVIHEAFAPSPAEVEKASKIVAAFDEARQRGLGVVSLGSKMIDPPVVQRAQKLVELAKRLGKA
jgi:citrate lyase beta subunit